MAGKSKKDEKGRDEMTDMAWRYWRQKSPLLPGIPSPGNKQPQNRQDAQEDEDAEKLARGRKTYNQVDRTGQLLRRC